MARAARALLAGLLAIAPVVATGTPARAAATVLLSDGFHNSTTSSPIAALNLFPGDATTPLPCLTAGADKSSAPIAGCGSPADSPGTGVLRLTDDETKQDAGVVYQPGFSLALGLSLEFKYYSYGGSGADGLSADLAVVDPTATPSYPTALGVNGGSLGYSTDPAGDHAGLPGGWLGFGFDTYGNYATSNADSPSCPENDDPLSQNAISVRGPGDDVTGYCLLSTVSPPGLTLDGTDRANAERGVKIVVDPTAGTYTVGIDSTGGTKYATVLSGPIPSNFYDRSGNSHTGMPASVTFVLAGSTGASTDFHEISDVVAATLTSPSQPPPPPAPPIRHNDHAGSNDPNPNTNPTDSTTATTATANNPTVSTSCSSACSLGAVTRDERVTIDAADTATGGGATVPAFTAASVGPAGTPVFALTIDGGGARPNCPGYRPRDRDWVQFAFESGGSTFRKTGTMTPNLGTSRPDAESRLAHDQVCFSAPYRFTPRPGFRLRHAGSWFDGVLPECTALAARSHAVPCVTDRWIVRVGDGWGVRLEFWVPPGRQDPKALG